MSAQIPYRVIIFLFLVQLCFLVSFKSAAQIRWDGGGGDNLWENRENWQGDQVPSSADEVMLDNTIHTGNYQVRLPAGMIAVTVRSITLNPVPGKHIELILPVENTMVPGLIATGPGYGLVINNGGIFRNASGADSGTPVKIADSIRVNNGGRYVHQSARGHAENISVLSAFPGTEEGIMEFDVPDASTTLSLSDRIYGKLILSAVAAGGALTYTAAGTKGLAINSDLEIGAGVNFSLNFSDTIFIRRDFIQQGGTVNLGNTSRSVVMAVRRRLVQTTGALLTETGTGKQAILLYGDDEQQIDLQGEMKNDISLIINGAGGILRSPLILTNRLELLKGMVTTTSANLLTLQGNSATILCDSLSNKSFINGPLQKNGLAGENFLFPVGKGGIMRWVMMKNASGNFIIEYFRKDPHTLGTTTSTGIDHISSLEHWSIQSSGGEAAGQVVLSFTDPNSGGVTNLADLRVTRFTGGTWQNLGNAGVSGSPGSNGSVLGTLINDYSSGNYFSLASSSKANPLPIFLNAFRVSMMRDKLVAEWETSELLLNGTFDLQSSIDGRLFQSLQIMKADPFSRRYTISHNGNGVIGHWFRLEMKAHNGTLSYSKIVYLPEVSPAFRLSLASAIYGQLGLNCISAKETRLQLTLVNIAGQTLKKLSLFTPRGRSVLFISLVGFPSGWYRVFGLSSIAESSSFSFYKP